jgi:hypothetical protein
VAGDIYVSGAQFVTAFIADHRDGIFPRDMWRFTGVELPEGGSCGVRELAENLGHALPRLVNGRAVIAPTLSAIYGAYKQLPEYRDADLQPHIQLAARVGLTVKEIARRRLTVGQFAQVFDRSTAKQSLPLIALAMGVGKVSQFVADSFQNPGLSLTLLVDQTLPTPDEVKVIKSLGDMLVVLAPLIFAHLQPEDYRPAGWQAPGVGGRRTRSTTTIREGDPRLDPARDLYYKQVLKAKGAFDPPGGELAKAGYVVYEHHDPAPSQRVVMIFDHQQVGNAAYLIVLVDASGQETAWPDSVTLSKRELIERLASGDPAVMGPVLGRVEHRGDESWKHEIESKLGVSTAAPGTT